MSTDDRQAFLLYISVFEAYQKIAKGIGLEAAHKFFVAVCEFAYYGVVPDDDDPVWLYGLPQTFASIKAAQDRREKSISNGSKGGRQRIELDKDNVMAKYAELKTWSKTAEFFGVNEDTLRARRKEWETQDYANGDPEKPEKPKNLTVTETVTITDTETETDNSLSANEADTERGYYETLIHNGELPSVAKVKAHNRILQDRQNK